MKRLYVLPAYRGKGYGRVLATAIIHRATQIGYQAIRLVTVSPLEAAVHLYRSLGFQDIPSYVEDHPMPPDVLFMELSLSPTREQTG